MRSVNIITTLLLWLTAAVRAPAAWRHREKRPLWTAFFALAVVLLIAPLTTSRLIDDVTSSNDLSNLLKHLCGLCAAACVVTFIHRMSGAKPTRFDRYRPRIVVPTAVAVAIIALFIATPRPFEASDLLVGYASDPRITTYGVIWTTYFGYTMISIARNTQRWAQAAGSSQLGRGLRFIGAGAVIGAVYVLHRVLMLIVHHYGLCVLPDDLAASLSRALVLAALVPILIGSTLPALGKTRMAVSDYFNLLRLRSLWLSLTDAVPSVRLTAPHSLIAERLNLRKVRPRLYRRTIEIRDALLTLNDHAPSMLREQARSHVLDAGLVGAQAEVAAEACWLHAARTARLNAASSSGEYRPPASGGRDLASEIQALRQLSDAYESDLAHSFAPAMEKAR